MKKFKWAGALAVVFICFALILFANQTDEIKADKEALKHISSNTSQKLVALSDDQKEKKTLKRIFSSKWAGLENLEAALENLDIQLDGLDAMVQDSVQNALSCLENLDFATNFDFDFRFDGFDFDFKELSKALEDLDFDFDFDFKCDRDKKSEKTERKKNATSKGKDLKKIK